MTSNEDMEVGVSPSGTHGGGSRRDLGFRMQSVERSAEPLVGRTSLVVPLPFKWYSIAALSLISLIIAFLMLGSYTKTEISDSVIVTDAGLARVKGKSDGVVAELHVREGDRVRSGAPLVGIRVEQQASEGGSGAADSDGGSPAIEYSSKIVVVKSPADGVVYQLPWGVGSSYSQYFDIAVVASEGDLSVTTQVSAAAQSRLRVGDIIPMTLDAYKGSPRARLVGRVASVALSPTEVYVRETRATLRTYKVVINLDPQGDVPARNDLLGKTVSIKMPVHKRRMYQWLLDPMKTLFGDG